MQHNLNIMNLQRYRFNVDNYMSNSKQLFSFQQPPLSAQAQVQAQQRAQNRTYTLTRAQARARALTQAQLRAQEKARAEARLQERARAKALAREQLSKISNTLIQIK